MSDDYQSNATNVMSVGQAENLGQNQATNFVDQSQKAADFGQTLQQQISKTQMMKQQLQQQMQDNRDAMVNHVGQSIYGLADADDDVKKGPVWKMQRDETVKKMQSLGVQVDPDVFEAYMKDPEHTGKLTAALATVMDPKQDAHTTAQALSTLHDNFSSMDEAVKAPDELLKAHAAVLSSTNKSGNQYEQRAKDLRNQVKGVTQKFDTTQSFGQEAKNILDDWKDFGTGQGEVALKDAYNKALSGGAPRSFTLAMMDNNRGWADKLDGFFSKAQSGQKLQPDERKDMQKALNIMLSDSNEKKLQETEPYFKATKALVGQAQDSGYNSLEPDQIMDPKLFNEHSNRSQGLKYNADTGKYDNIAAPGSSKPAARQAPVKAPTKAPAIGDYSVGANQQKDNFLKSTISSGASLDQVNKILTKYKMKMSPDTYNQLKGGQ